MSLRLNISYSSMELLASCSRKFQLSKVLNLDSKETSVPASAGTALHEGWYEFLKTRDKQAALYKMMLAYPVAYAPSPSYAWSLESTFASLLELCEYPLFEDYELAYINSEPAIEVPFEMKLEDQYLDPKRTIQLYYVGFIDVILWNKKTEVYVAVDLKNTARFSNNYEAFYKYSSQMIPYGLVLETVLGHRGDVFSVMYLQNFVSLKEPRVDQYTFYVEKEERLQDFLIDVMTTAQRLQMFYKFDRWPRRGSSCVAYGKTCPFFENCDNAAQELLETFSIREDHFENYREKAWNIKLTVD